MALVERLRTDAIGSAAQRLCALEQRLTDALQEESRTSPQTAEETRALQAQVDSVVKRLADMRELAELPTRGVLALTPERERLRDGPQPASRARLLSEIRQQGACQQRGPRELGALGAEINALRAIRFAALRQADETGGATDAAQRPAELHPSGHAAPLQVELADGEDVGQTLELLQKHMGSIVRLLSDSDGHPAQTRWLDGWRRSPNVSRWRCAIRDAADAATTARSQRRSRLRCETYSQGNWSGAIRMGSSPGAMQHMRKRWVRSSERCKKKMTRRSCNDRNERSTT